MVKLSRCLAVLTVLSAAMLWSTPVSAQDPALIAAIAQLPVATEKRAGYDRDLFRHWIDEDSDGCSTRQEVLLAEATTAPQVAADCTISGGSWYSSYDDVVVNDARRLDIDHMVPLAEAWDSGASAWTPERRQVFANDLQSDTSLIAVTASSNRSKSDQDPAEWLPPHTAVTCDYVTDWVDVKLRWQLAIDAVERDALNAQATDCPG